MKRPRVIVLIAVILATGAYSLIHYYNPFAPADIDEMLSLGPDKMELIAFKDTGGMTQMTLAQVNRKYERNWRDLETLMRKTGASDEEVRGVLASVRKEFSFKGEYTDFIYGVPTGVRRIWHRFQPVWIINFHWGIGYEDPKGGLTESPSHVRTYAISGRKPFKVLGMRTCG
jgi:hypothetical protein